MHSRENQPSKAAVPHKPVRLAASVTLSIAAAAALLSGCAGDKSDHAAIQLPPADEKVQALFKANCQSCHGANLEGRAGPTTNLQHVGSRLSQQGIAKQIVNGGGNMPAFGSKLKPDEVSALAAWLAASK